MLKSKMMFGILAVAMILALGQSGYAQLQLSILASDPNPTATATDLTADTADPNTVGGITIEGSVIGDLPITGGVLRVTYPSTVTNACIGATTSSTSTAAVCGSTYNLPAFDPVQVSQATGIFLGAHVTAVDAINGRVDVSLPCSTSVQGNTAAASGTVVTNFGALELSNNSTLGPLNSPSTMTGLTGTMVLHGVRIDASALTAFPVNATISSTKGNGTSVVAANGRGNAVNECYNPLATGGGNNSNATVSSGSTNGSSNSPQNIFLPAVTTAAIINASAAGIAAVSTGGIPTSVGTPTAGSTTTSGSTASPGVFGSFGSSTALGQTIGTGTTGGCSGADLFHQDCGIATVYTNRNIPRSVGSFTLNEGHANAWFRGDAGAFSQFVNASYPNDGAFQLTFNNVPAGVTLNVGVLSFTSGVPSLSNTTITTANNTTKVTWNANLSTTNKDWVTIGVSIGSVSTSATLTAGASVTVSATMFPTGSALDLTTASNSLPSPLATMPRYVSTMVGNATVLNIVSANTTMLIPFALTTTGAAGLDTGIAIANTSVDPFSGAGGATANSGTVQVNLYPQYATGTQASASVTTSATKKAGQGMAADGTVPPGSTWTVNMSDLLSLAGQTAPFEGYVFIQANFVPAHGIAYIYGSGVFGGSSSATSTFTSFTPVLVLPPPATQSRTGGTVESLDF